MMCFQLNGSWSLTQALPWVWLVEDEVSVFFPAQQGNRARMREKTFWMPSPYCIWHYRPLLTPSVVHSLFQPHLSLPVHSSCPPAYCVSPLLIIITCFLSLLVSLPFTHCLQLHTYSHTEDREGREGGAGMGWKRVNVWERRKERVASICVLSVLFSWAKTLLTSSLTCQWKRKNCQIVFQDVMQLAVFRVMRKQVWLPIIP